MDLKEQKYVCTLAECKSLTRASERLYISQPALSLYINNVEKNLGAPLFERNGRKFELTWLGKQYVEKASQMLELERQFEAVMRQTEQSHRSEGAGQGSRALSLRREPPFRSADGLRTPSAKNPPCPVGQSPSRTLHRSGSAPQGQAPGFSA